MDASEIEQYLANIATRLRAWRGNDGLTLQQVASRSGVAASTIQKVESRQMVPTIAVLFKIAQGLGRGPAELIEADPAEPDVVLQTCESRRSEHAASVEQLTGRLADSQLGSWRLVYRDGEGAGPFQLDASGEILLVCEGGQLNVSLGDESYRLTRGDSLHFKTRRGICWHAVGPQPAELLLLGTDVVGLSQVVGQRRS